MVRRNLAGQWIACIILACAAFGVRSKESQTTREEVFAFAAKPSVTREGDLTKITFESKGFCDCAVAIEDSKGRIIRHLAAGVLGPNAPAPFEVSSRKQSIVWDGKDDQGHPVKTRAGLRIRVSLGLKPRFERTLYWSPKKRIAPGNAPIFASAPEGVYVHEGGGVDHIRLFDHQGNYIRTVYPFPPDRSSPESRSGPKALQVALAGIKGLQWMKFPQDDRQLPVWRGLKQATLFTSGNNVGQSRGAMYGVAATAMAAQGKHLALAMLSLNRLSTDGKTGEVTPAQPPFAYRATPPKKKPVAAFPRSAAFSPDGKTLYLAGFGNARTYLHGVLKLDYPDGKAPSLFAGSMDQNKHGTDNQHFRCAMSVACDNMGRVYVADYMNNRIQVYTPDGKHYKTVAPVKHPLNIFVHPKTGHIYVASWMLCNQHVKSNSYKIPATFVHYGPLEAPKKISSFDLPLIHHNPTAVWNRFAGLQFNAFLDGYADPPTLWVVPGKGDTDSQLLQLRRSYSPTQHKDAPWSETHLQLLIEKDGKLVKKADFARDVAKSVAKVDPPLAPAGNRQRLYINPASGLLYVAEGDGGVGKAFRRLVEIDPNTGKRRLVGLPFLAEDIAFDLEGRILLRTDLQVARFDLWSGRERPWKLGEEAIGSGYDGRDRPLIGGITLPGTGRPKCFHLGGLGVSPTGSFAAFCNNTEPLRIHISMAFSASFKGGRPFRPKEYPGRLRWGEIHVWDHRGQTLHRNAVGGLPMTDGLAIDRDNNIYALVAANRVVKGKPYPLQRAETLIKFKPGKGRIISTAKKGVPTPITPDAAPKRPFDLSGSLTGDAWVEGAEWMYGGVGFGGFNDSRKARGCACWNARFALDFYARSFVTELNRFCVAVLDTNGNLIMRIGKYGNVDDGVPLIKDGGPPNPRPAGGDEVVLCNPSYVATHTDRRLFIADYGNYRILSVKLDYHATEKVAIQR